MFTSTTAGDLAAEKPQELAELKRFFDIEAAKYHVLPLDARLGEVKSRHGRSAKPGHRQHPPVVRRYAPPQENVVTDQDRLINSKERFRIAMAKQ